MMTVTKPWPWCSLDPDLPARRRHEARLRASIIARLGMAPEEPGKAPYPDTTAKLLECLLVQSEND